ncbi:MAG: EpsG family protein, partial [Gammaproteobacteria bacterium]|nr:EpsG family protein [Gammaproteobacteria bacterium]
VIFAALVLVAFLFHQTSLLLVLAALLGRYRAGWMPFALLFAPLVSFVSHEIAALLGVNLSQHIHYADYDEGTFHWTKFIVAYGLAWLTWWLHDRNDSEVSWLTASYGYMVALSSLLLRYEVPFERMLLYSEFFLPIVLVLILFRRKILLENFVYLWCAGVLLGVALWTHPSIVTTLGY